MNSTTHKNKVVNEYIIYVVSDIDTPITADVVYGEDDRDMVIKQRYLKYFEEGTLITNILDVVSHKEFMENLKNG